MIFIKFVFFQACFGAYSGSRGLSPHNGRSQELNDKEPAVYKEKITEIKKNVMENTPKKSVLMRPRKTCA